MNKSIFKSIGAILAGFLLAAVLSVITDLLLETTGVMKTKPFSDNPTWLIIIIVFYRSIYNIFGCYLAARLAPTRPMRHALILGTIGFVFCILGAIVMWHVPPHWYPLSLIVLALPCAWLGGKLGSTT